MDFYLVVFSLLFYIIFGLGNGLRCRLENDLKSQEEFEEIVKNCLNVETSESNNRNKDRHNNKHWNNRGNDHHKDRNNNRGRYDSDEDQDGDRRDGNRKDNNNGGGRRKQQNNKYNNKDSNERDYDYESDRWFGSENKRRQPGKKGNSDSSSYSYGSNGRRQQNDDNRYSGDRYNHFFNTSRGTGSSSYLGSPLENVDACVIHCVFRQMKMVSDNSYLSRNSVLNALTRRIKDQELKSFVQETINECFENLDPEEEDMCDFSKAFALCVEEKGKSNCDDWDMTMKFNKKNKTSQNNRGNLFPSPSKG